MKLNGKTALRRIATLGLLLIAAAHASAAAPQDSRPQLGVAFGGGGARGFAHLGIIEWFEEHRIPIDHIAGTSMGGLIGGMYAMGMPPEEIRQVLHSFDWDALLGQAAPYDERTIRRKERARDFPGAIRFEWNGGPQLPRGLNTGYAVEFMLDRITLPYYDLERFSSLPIPFKCVATDIVNGTRVVLESGSLSRALRATLAVPALFTPAEIDGKFLVDGGLLNNLPTDVVRDMSAGVVIGVEVGTPLRDQDAVGSLIGILDQSIGIMMRENVVSNRKLANILITPDLEMYGFSDFDAIDEIAALGYEAAEKSRIALERHALDETAWAQHIEKRRSLRRTEIPAVDAVAVSGGKAQTNEAVQSLLLNHVGRRVDESLIERDLSRIYGWGHFDALNYGLARRGNAIDLAVAAKERREFPTLDFGIEASGSDSARINFNLVSRLTFYEVGGYGGEWRIDGSAGESFTLGTEYYRPLKGAWFVAPRAQADRTTTDIFQASRRVAEYVFSTRSAGIDVGYGFRRRFDEVRLGYEVGDVNASVRIGEPVLPSLEGDTQSLSIRWLHDRQDSATVPTKGLRTSVRMERFLASPGTVSDFWRGSIDGSAFLPVGGQQSFLTSFSGGTTFRLEAPTAHQFTLGGPFRIGAFELDEFRGSRLIYASAGYMRHFDAPNPLLGRIHLLGWYETGATWPKSGKRDYLKALSGGVLVDSIIGPVFAGGSVGEAGRVKLYISIGRRF